MKKITFLLIAQLMIIGSIFSQIGIATVCDGEGNCLEYTRVKPGPLDPWENACCSHFENLPPGHSCTDDCEEELEEEELLIQPYEDESFASALPTFTMPSGNNVWIYEDDELLVGTLGTSSPEYIHMNSSSELYDNINNSQIEYIGVEIDANTDAVIDRVISSTRLKGKAIENYLDESESITLYPNPITIDEDLSLIVRNISFNQVVLVNSLGQQLLLKVRISETGSSLYRIRLPKNIGNGLYFVKIQGTNNSTIIKKLMIVD